jgi:dipeptidyl aminopeptidase/acylaminoacyl peptidase
MTTDARLDETIRAALSWEAERAAKITPPFDQAMRELAEKLAMGPSVRSASPRLQRRVVVLLAAALLLAALLIGAIVAGLYRGSAADAFTRMECISETECAYSLFVVDANGEHRIYPTSDAEAAVIQDAAWAPDGSQLGFVAGTRVAATPSAPQGAEAMAVHVVNRDGSGLRRLYILDEDEGSCGLSWAPDAGSIGLCVWGPGSTQSGHRATTMITVDTATGASATLADAVVTAAPQWSPDGSRILYQAINPPDTEGFTTSSAWIVGADGTGRQLVSSLAPLGSMGEFPVAWAPDSQAIAIESRSAKGEATIEIVRLDGSRTAIVPRREASLSYQRYVVDIEALAWSPRGEIAYAARGNGFIEVAIMSLEGESQTVTTADDVDLASAAQGMWWSSDGRHLSWLAHDPAVLGYCIVTFSLEAQSMDERCFSNSDSVASAFGS